MKIQFVQSVMLKNVFLQGVILGSSLTPRQSADTPFPPDHFFLSFTVFCHSELRCLSAWSLQAVACCMCGTEVPRGKLCQLLCDPLSQQIQPQLAASKH